ncbi:MAG: type II secretion system F family protein, partial [Planctomycetes bacterium]|nr:type II secretion system F family protein [Planctomycetota bacterium]
MPWAIFIAITAGVWAVAAAFSKEESRATERLEELRDPTLRDKKKS